MKSFPIIFVLSFVFHISFAQKAKPEPSIKNIHYGEHDRNVLDIWFAQSKKNTPLVIYIHGGAFSSGSKEKLNSNTLSQLLEEGISVAAINYRLLSNAPLPAAHNDAKLALQFIRSRAKEWKIDKNKIALFGGSAGAQICMWLAFSDDMANTNSSNPIEQESTRVLCIAPKIGQTTMKREFWNSLAKRHIGNINGKDYTTKVFGNTKQSNTRLMRMFGCKTIEEAMEKAEDVSALDLITADDPPVYMEYYMSPNAAPPSNPKKIKGWLIHHVDFGVALKQKMDELHMEVDLKYPGSQTKYGSIIEFFKAKLVAH